MIWRFGIFRGLHLASCIIGFQFVVLFQVISSPSSRRLGSIGALVYLVPMARDEKLYHYRFRFLWLLRLSAKSVRPAVTYREN